MTVAGGLKKAEQNNNQEARVPQPTSAKLGASGSVQAAWWQPAIIMFLKLSVWIAVPIIIALYLGEWLDNKYDSSPWLFLTCLGLAFAISIFGLIKSASRELEKFEKNGKN